MKKGDRVYVKWPTGKGGPYEVIVKNQYGYRLKIEHNGTEEMILDTSWCEPAEPEIEEGRLVRGADDEGFTDYGTYIRPSKHDKSKSVVWSDGAEVKLKDVIPVHRRWDELTESKQQVWLQREGYCTCDDFRFAYKLITGEEHP
jgi:hypothetical protein